MIFLSTLLRQSVYDLEGRRLGGIRDICVTLQETFPVVTALIVHTPLGNSHADLIIPWFQVYSLEEPQIHLVVILSSSNPKSKHIRRNPTSYSCDAIFWISKLWIPRAFVLSKSMISS